MADETNSKKQFTHHVQQDAMIGNGLSTQAHHLHVVLLGKSNRKTGELKIKNHWFTRAQLAHSAGISERTFDRQIRELESKGYVKRAQKRVPTNHGMQTRLGSACYEVSETPKSLWAKDCGPRINKGDRLRASTVRQKTVGQKTACSDLAHQYYQLPEEPADRIGFAVSEGLREAPVCVPVRENLPVTTPAASQNQEPDLSPIHRLAPAALPEKTKSPKPTNPTEAKQAVHEMLVSFDVSPYQLAGIEQELETSLNREVVEPMKFAARIKRGYVSGAFLAGQRQDFLENMIAYGLAMNQGAQLWPKLLAWAETLFHAWNQEKPVPEKPSEPEPVPATTEQKMEVFDQLYGPGSYQKLSLEREERERRRREGRERIRSRFTADNVSVGEYGMRVH
jgi:hypothetical protein